MKIDQPTLCQIIGNRLRRWDPEDLLSLAEDILGAEIEFEDDITAPPNDKDEVNVRRGIFTISKWVPSLPEVGDIVSINGEVNGVASSVDKTSGFIRVLMDNWTYRNVPNTQVSVLSKAYREGSRPLEELHDLQPRDYIRQIIARARETRNGTDEEKQKASQEIKELNRRLNDTKEE